MADAADVLLHWQCSVKMDSKVSWSFERNTVSAQNWGWHLFLVSIWVFKPTKGGREVSRLFCVSEVMTPLVTSYCGRQLTEKLTAQFHLMVIDWLLIALSHMVQSVWNLLMFLKLVELDTNDSSFLKISLWTLSTSEQLKHIRCCTACNIHGLSSFIVKHKNHFFATMCWDKVRPSC